MTIVVKRADRLRKRPGPYLENSVVVVHRCRTSSLTLTAYPRAITGHTAGRRHFHGSATIHPYGWGRRIWRSDCETTPVSVTQNEKAARFRALHDGPGAFVSPNPWDVGSARILAGLGFRALATSSAASACAVSRRDGGQMRDEARAHARLIVDATDLPVSADLEKGFGDAAEVVTETIRLAAEVGLAGCAIEDATGNPTPGTRRRGGTTG